jgi:hypothetical protein
MTRLTAILMVVLAVLAPTLALASTHCLVADCDGPCVPGVTTITLVLTVALVAAAPAITAPRVASPALRLLEQPPRPLPVTF